MSSPDLIYYDMLDVATEFGVTYETVRKWRTRGIFPEPDNRFGRSPVWTWNTLSTWGKQTGRLEESSSPIE